MLFLEGPTVIQQQSQSNLHTDPCLHCTLCPPRCHTILKRGAVFIMRHLCLKKMILNEAPESWPCNNEPTSGSGRAWKVLAKSEVKVFHFNIQLSQDVRGRKNRGLSQKYSLTLSQRINYKTDTDTFPLGFPFGSIWNSLLTFMSICLVIIIKCLLFLRECCGFSE